MYPIKLAWGHCACYQLLATLFCARFVGFDYRGSDILVEFFGRKSEFHQRKTLHFIQRRILTLLRQVEAVHIPLWSSSRMLLQATPKMCKFWYDRVDTRVFHTDKGSVKRKKKVPLCSWVKLERYYECKVSCPATEHNDSCEDWNSFRSIWSSAR